MILAVDFEQTVGLGSLLVGLIVAFVGLVILFYGARWRAAYTVAATQADELRKALGDERGRAERAETRERDSLRILAEQKQTITRLESLPDLSRILDYLAKQEEGAVVRARDAVAAVESFLAVHEERAQDRHESQIAVLSGLAAHLEKMKKANG